jgi:predicted ester cyclase
MLRGSSDFRGDIQDIFASGDRVCARIVFSGTHEGSLFGQPGTGKKFTVNMINIYRLEDGKVAESWQPGDLAGFMKQIGGEATPNVFKGRRNR